jgi:hypothetical protein
MIFTRDKTKRKSKIALCREGAEGPLCSEKLS